jgi:hypothetical protein
MSAARHMIALLKSHLEGDDKEVLSVAMQAAAHEARLGHIAIAQRAVHAEALSPASWPWPLSSSESFDESMRSARTAARRTMWAKSAAS